jgi:hypothetical protein
VSGLRQCPACEQWLRMDVRATYCSPACRQAAWRSRTQRQQAGQQSSLRNVIRFCRGRNSCPCRSSLRVHLTMDESRSGLFDKVCGLSPPGLYSTLSLVKRSSGASSPASIARTGLIYWADRSTLYRCHVWRHGVSASSGKSPGEQPPARRGLETRSSAPSTDR